jgi:hypothetical protein
MTEPVKFKRAPVGDNQDDYFVLEKGVVVDRIFRRSGRDRLRLETIYQLPHGICLR